MLFELCFVPTQGVSVRTMLAERSIPAKMLWLGDERFVEDEARQIPGAPTIFVDYDDEGQDTYAPAIGAPHATVRQFASCQSACRATIEGASTKPGANLHDHQRLVRRVADGFLVALIKAAHVRRLAIPEVIGRFVSLGADGSQAGARYRFSFSVHRSVSDAPFTTVDGTTLGVSLTTTVRIGDTEAPVCGGN